MYLSTLLIDVGTNPDRPRPGRMWLRNVYHVHQRLCMAFPSNARNRYDPHFVKPYQPQDFAHSQLHVVRDADARFLFRIDPLPGGRVMIVVQSAVRPDWDYAFHNAQCLLAAQPNVQAFDPNFRQDEVLRFCLVANATRKIDTKSGPGGQRRNGRRVPVQQAHLQQWLTSRAGRHGFAIVPRSLAVEPGYVYVTKPATGTKCRLYSARYKGLLRVVDPGRLRETLLRGLGPAKAFGFGLLSVKRTY